MNFPNDSDSHLHEVPSSPQDKLLSLPLEGWPESFGATRPSPDNTCYEVVLNEKAGTEAGKIWKFYPPDPVIVRSLLDFQKQIILLPPFFGDADLQDTLNDLVGCVINCWIIEDSFTDHQLRRTYADSVEGAGVMKYCKNISKMRAIFHHLSMVVDNVRKPLHKNNVDVPVDPLLTDLPFSGRKFDDTKTFDGKVQFLTQIDGCIEQYLRDILVALTQP